jgi:nucleotide-binding universal stress UspA family protein
MFKLILVSTDGTTQSNHAVKTAAKLATDLGATLMVFHASRSYQSHYYPDAAGLAWPPEKRYMKESLAGADKLLTSATALAKKLGAKATTAHSYSDSPAEAIIAAAKKFNADLIVMASHGRKGLDKLLLGSETQRVLARTTLPVLVVR